MTSKDSLFFQKVLFPFTGLSNLMVRQGKQQQRNHHQGNTCDICSLFPRETKDSLATSGPPCRWRSSVQGSSIARPQLHRYAKSDAWEYVVKVSEVRRGEVILLDMLLEGKTKTTRAGVRSYCVLLMKVSVL